MNAADEALLAEAVELAHTAVQAGELPYASLLTDDTGRVVARDVNTVLSSGDITAHPELKLARWAASTYPVDQRATITMYTNCEPCLMCGEVIARAGLRRVVYALSTERLRSRQSAGTEPATRSDVVFEGPALDARAEAPIDAYYAQPRP